MHNIHKQVSLILFELFAFYKVYLYCIYIHLSHHDNEYRISLLNWTQAIQLEVPINNRRKILFSWLF